MGSASYEKLSRGYPGDFTALLSTSIRVVADGASWTAIGALVVALFVLAAPRSRALESVAGLELRVLRYALLTWMVAAAALVPVDAADANGVSIVRLAEPGALAYLVKPYQKSELIPAVEVALGRFREMSTLAAEIASLEERLEARKSIDRAKGVLMDKHRMSEADSFSFIQKRAMRDRVTMKSVAERILSGELSPES